MDDIKWVCMLGLVTLWHPCCKSRRFWLIIIVIILHTQTVWLERDGFSLLSGQSWKQCRYINFTCDRRGPFVCVNVLESFIKIFWSNVDWLYVVKPIVVYWFLLIRYRSCKNKSRTSHFIDDECVFGIMQQYFFYYTFRNEREENT